ncbi:MAG: sensor histidine kinase KdpD, partial [Lachnospiraceae bacterium]|nr:sensor histidine kinase KdpD [Lachnospiraceae bacterium]
MEENHRPPQPVPQPVSRTEYEKGRGHLKIFFGYADGVGKTYAMLQAAHSAKQRGIDVVAGYVEPHGRPQTSALLHGLEQIPNLVINHNGISLKEFDLDAAIKRKPTLILIDELAHTNAQECRHAKRYQDVEELLKAGIDVYTTVNVHHIESLNDIVAAITGIMVSERVPDSVFDNASQVELIDIEPQELMERLQSGNVYREGHAKTAAENFFQIENLIALREIALRRCADRINTLSEEARIRTGGDYHTDEHILVCLSPAPSNMKIIRTAARMAKAFRGSFTALYVETSDFAAMDEEDKKRLRSNTRLAEQLGAKIETVYGEDVAFQIAEFARLSGISKIVIGRSMVTRKSIFRKPGLTEKLISQAPNLDIHIIPDSTSEMVYRAKTAGKKPEHLLNTADVIKSIGMIILASAIGFVFWKLGMSEANIIMVYILGVLITSVITTHQIYSLISSIVSVFVFNFLFTEPRYTLLAYEKDYPVTFITMFVAAFLTGSLAIRLKRQAKQAAQAAYRTKILFDTNQLLEGVREKEPIITVTATQLIKLLNRDMIIYPAEKEALSEPKFFAVNGETVCEEYLSENERAVAFWVFRNNKHAGATTDTLSESKCLYLSIRTSNDVYGVIGIVIHNNPLDSFENSILLSILGECALALENEKNAREKAEAALVAQKEQLRANLLRSISHDLRTPLTSISGNASNLLSNGEQFDIETKQQLYSDIYDDSMWLINLVENLLSVTRIEEGRLNIRLQTELLDEVITEALQHISRKKTEHKISFQASEDFILVKIDARLIMQVIINIVDNAIKYTQKDSEILITTQKLQDRAVVRIADNGPGISDDMKPLVFDMFYSGAKNMADSRRSLGLGLSLCKSIVTAHGGSLELSDNIPHGAVFTFSLPVE